MTKCSLSLSDTTSPSSLTLTGPSVACASRCRLSSDASQILIPSARSASPLHNAVAVLPVPVSVFVVSCQVSTSRWDGGSGGGLNEEQSPAREAQTGRRARDASAYAPSTACGTTATVG
jgi:hypothetical protein